MCIYSCVQCSKYHALAIISKLHIHQKSFLKIFSNLIKENIYPGVHWHDADDEAVKDVLVESYPPEYLGTSHHSSVDDRRFFSSRSFT